MTKETWLPSKYFPELVDVDKFVAACGHHYKEIMERLLQNKALQDLKNGYYDVEEDEATGGGVVTYMLDIRVPKNTLKFQDAATGQIAIKV